MLIRCGAHRRKIVGKEAMIQHAKELLKLKPQLKRPN